SGWLSPEGRVARPAFLLPCRRGFEPIAKRTPNKGTRPLKPRVRSAFAEPVPIFPVCLGHVGGSIFSYRGGKIIWKWPQELPYPVSVEFGAPMPPTATAGEVRLAIQKLSADCAIRRSSKTRSVHRQFVRMASR